MDDYICGDNGITHCEGIIGSPGRYMMALTVAWLTDINEALSAGKSQGKPVLLDFFNPN